MRRARQAAILLTMATVIGWSGPSADARASRVEQDDAVNAVPVAVPALPALGGSTKARVAGGEWRYVSSRR